MDPREYRENIKDDALSVLCGKHIASGVARDVYVYAVDPDQYVVKVEADSAPQYQNVKEFLVWQEYMHHKKLAPWFAPIRYLSHNGKWLVMRRTKPVTISELRKEVPRVPSCFTDLKDKNWGRLDGRIVCHDYGTLLLGRSINKMTKAAWWEG